MNTASVVINEYYYSRVGAGATPLILVDGLFCSILFSSCHLVYTIHPYCQASKCPSIWKTRYQNIDILNSTRPMSFMAWLSLSPATGGDLHR